MCTECDHLLQNEGNRKSHHPDKIKQNLLSRLNKAEGQIRGVKKMIESDAYCDDVINQITAVQSALSSVAKLLLDAHVKSCIVNRIMTNDLEAVDELLTTINKFIK